MTPVRSGRAEGADEIVAERGPELFLAKIRSKQRSIDIEYDWDVDPGFFRVSRFHVYPSFIKPN